LKLKFLTLTFLAQSAQIRIFVISLEFGRESSAKESIGNPNQHKIQYSQSSLKISFELTDLWSLPPGVMDIWEENGTFSHSDEFGIFS